MVRLLFLIILFTSHISHPASLYAEAASANDLIENAGRFDGKMVVIDGEAITAIMKRGDFAWINLEDGNIAMGVWSPASLLDEVKYLGDYKHKGDILEVEGVFNRACELHKGELDIHASRITILAHGSMIEERVKEKRLKLSFILFFAVLAVTLLFRKRF